MSGFGLYETLRISVPGIFAVLLTDLTIRFSHLADLPSIRPDVLRVLEMLEEPFVALGGGVFMGLLLYAADLPTRLTIYKIGDPARKYIVPSETLRILLGKSPLADQAFTIYFLLSDRYLAPETHRRIYLFGSLFRVFVDLRFLLALSGAAGAMLAILFGSDAGTFDLRDGLNRDTAIMVCAVLAGALVIGLSIGVRGRIARSFDARVRKGHNPRTVRIEANIRKDLLVMAPTALLILVLGWSAIVLAGMQLLLARAAAVVVAVMAVALWFSVEIGPPIAAGGEENEGDAQPGGEPPPAPSRFNRGSWRSEILASLGAQGEEPQFSPVQRLLCDLAYFAPWLMGVAIAGANAGRPPIDMLMWSLLVFPCVLIMAVRKHEERLVQAYRDQSRWLELHEQDIAKIANENRLPDRWQ